MAIDCSDLEIHDFCSTFSGMRVVCVWEETEAQGAEARQIVLIQEELANIQSFQNFYPSKKIIVSQA